MGAGTKLPHNVMGLFGVANSSDGDLRPGLPLQMIENHDPVRLMMIIEQDPKVVLKVIQSNPEVYSWFSLGWIHLAVVSPFTGEVYYFQDQQFERFHAIKTASYTDDILELIEKTPAMKSNHILDATKENIPVHIYQNKKK
jgi:uncharacterized protein